MEKKQYQIEYDEFMQKCRMGSVSPEETGIMIARMAQYFCEQNMDLASAEKELNKKAAENVDMIDEATGKLISVSKAEILTKASEEYGKAKSVEVHLTNIEQIINALKSLQKGILNEYSHMGGV